jgi:mono/diheme cytochrome c family protein
MSSIRLPLLFVVIWVASAAVADADEAEDLSGAELYQRFCGSCHGAAARTLKAKVPDLTRITARNGGTFPAERVRQTIAGRDVPTVHGSRDMPVWGWQFYAFEGEDPVRRARVAELIGHMVDHLASIQRR